MEDTIQDQTNLNNDTLNNNNKFQIKNTFLVNKKTFDSNNDKGDSSVLVQVVDDNNKNTFIHFYKVEKKIELDDSPNTINLSGIKIEVKPSISDSSKMLENFEIIKPVVKLAFRLITLAFHEDFSNLSEENASIISDQNFKQLKTSLLKLGIGSVISFLYFFHNKIKESDKIELTDELPNIFDDTEKSSFIKKSSAFVDLHNNQNDDFLLIYNKSIISSMILEKLKLLLLNDLLPSKYKSFSEFRKDSKNE